MLHELWNCLHWPFCPGVCIAILAFFAAFVAFRVEKAGRVEKAIWTFVFLMLVVGEIWMVGVDREKHDKEQSDARAEQLRRFQEIAAGINGSNEVNKQHFDDTMSSMKTVMNTAQKSLDQVTGNRQFCYVEVHTYFRTATQPETYHLRKMNSGPLPLDVCHIVVRDEGFQKIFEGDLGPVPPGKDWLVQNVTSIVLPRPGKYHIEIFTRNDRFVENLSFDPGGSQKVEVRNLHGKVLGTLIVGPSGNTWTENGLSPE